jgi:ADP-ribosylglycohydrolase
MRVAPIGAWHAGNPDRAAGLARTQALVTHAHPEAADGAAAVAAVAAVLSTPGPAAEPVTLLRAAAHHAGPGRVRDGLHRAQHLLGSSIEEAAAALGTGRDAAAYDTVPFALWSAVQTPADFVATFWRTVSGLGDRDTTCAIAGAIVAAHAGADAVPRGWMEIVEPLPGWAQGDVRASRRL